MKTSYQEKSLFLSIVERCPPQAILLDKIDSYDAMNRWVDRLHLACYVLFVMPIILYATLYELGMTQSMHRKSFFWVGILMLSMFTDSSLCHQLATSFACRPIEIIFDWRYMSMVGMQIFACFVCLHHAYVFASVYLIPSLRRRAPSERVGKTTSDKPGDLALLLHSKQDLEGLNQIHPPLVWVCEKAEETFPVRHV